MGQPESNHGRTGNHWPPEEAEFPAQITIPEHQLLRRIGRGSYGQVWLARNAMGAFRAVKIVFRDSFDNERPFARELSGIKKFEPVSRLHEGFVDVLQVGINEQGGYFYYIMEVADDQVGGRNINPAAYEANTLATEIARRGRLSPAECLQLGLALTRALAELHKHDLVHRDIKPSNVVFVDGVPKLADIGLVTGVDDTRSYVGTAGFIAPEGPGKPAADLYSLGMVLYEACTGKDRNEFPLLPADWNDSPDYEGLLELNEIILQACKDNPTERYRSAWDMHADLVVVLNGKSVKRLRQLEKRMAYMKRMAGASVLLLLLAALIGYSLYREWDLRTREHRREIDIDIAYGNRAMEGGNLFGALPYFTEALRLDAHNTRGEQNGRLRVGALLAESPKLTHVWFEPMKVKDVEFSPDDRTLLVAQYYFGRAVLYDLAAPQKVTYPFTNQPGLRSALFSPDGRRILTTTEFSEAIVWDASSFAPLHSLPHTNKVYTGHFSPDSSRIVTACSDGFARIWNAESGQLELVIPAHSQVASVRFSHDGRLLATASHDGNARLWNAATGQPAGPLLSHSGWVNHVAFSPDDTRLLTASDDHRVRIWDVASGTRILPDLVHDDAVETADFSPDGRLILTASFDGTVRLWQASDHLPVPANPVLRHGERVMHASFSADGRRIVTAANDGTIRIWDLASANVPPPRKRRQYSSDGSCFLDSEHGFQMLSLTNGGSGDNRRLTPITPVKWARLGPNGSFVFTVSTQIAGSQTNYVLQVWDAQTVKPAGPALLEPAPFAGAVMSEDGQRIAVYRGSQAAVYDVRSAKALAPAWSAVGDINNALFNPDGKLLVTVSGTNVQVWNSASGSPAYPPLVLPVPVVYAEFSRDGRYLVTCSSDPTLTRCSAVVWDAQTGRQVGEPLRHGDGVLYASFSPDGSRIVTASEDFTAKVWDVTTGRQIGLPLRHTSQVEAAAWSPDGQWVATAGVDQVARVWDPQTGDPLTPPLRNPFSVWAVGFLCDGRHIAVGDGFGNTSVWSLPVESKPLSDLEAMADLLSGGDFISPVAPRKPAEPLKQLWPRLCQKYPADFTVGAEAIVQWHEYQMQSSEAEQDWAAAFFHLQRLQKLCPDDPTVHGHLDYITKHLPSR